MTFKRYSVFVTFGWLFCCVRVVAAPVGPGGFWRAPDTTAPPALTAFTAATGARPGETIVTLDFPADTSDIERVDLKRVAGATAPADCSGGTVQSFAAPYTDPTAHTVAYTTGAAAGASYSYRACIYDAWGNVTSSNTATNVMARRHIIFFTQATWTGAAVGGSAGADTKCQAAANTAGIGGAGTTFVALLATSTVSAIAKVNIVGEVWNRRPAGSGGPQKVVDTEADMFDGTLDTAIHYTEAGGETPDREFAFTGSTTAGLNTGSNCVNWTSDSDTPGTTRGDRKSAVADWIREGATDNWNCSTDRGLYCVDQP